MCSEHIDMYALAYSGHGSNSVHPYLQFLLRNPPVSVLVHLSEHLAQLWLSDALHFETDANESSRSAKRTLRGWLNSNSCYIPLSCKECTRLWKTISSSKEENAPIIKPTMKMNGKTLLRRLGCCVGEMSLPLQSRSWIAYDELIRNR